MNTNEKEMPQEAQSILAGIAKRLAETAERETGIPKSQLAVLSLEPLRIGQRGIYYDFDSKTVVREAIA